MLEGGMFSEVYAKYQYLLATDWQCGRFYQNLHGTADPNPSVKGANQEVETPLPDVTKTALWCLRFVNLVQEFIVWDQIICHQKQEAFLNRS